MDDCRQDGGESVSCAIQHVRQHNFSPKQGPSDEWLLATGSQRRRNVTLPCVCHRGEIWLGHDAIHEGNATRSAIEDTARGAWTETRSVSLFDDTINRMLSRPEGENTSRLIHSCLHSGCGGLKQMLWRTLLKRGKAQHSLEVETWVAAALQHTVPAAQGPTANPLSRCHHAAEFPT